jgi:hypothetical protein
MGIGTMWGICNKPWQVIYVSKFLAKLKNLQHLQCIASFKAGLYYNHEKSIFFKDELPAFPDVFCIFCHSVLINH